MSLTDLFAVADSLSPMLQAAQVGARATVEHALAFRDDMVLPQVRANTAIGYLGDGYGWSRDGSGDAFSVQMPHFSTRFGLEAQQVVYSGGAARAAMRQAEVTSKMSQIGYRQARQDVRMQVAGYYLDLYGALSQLAVLDSNIALAERLVEDIGARRSEGAALRNDQTRYELQLSDLRLNRLSVQHAAEVLQRKIASMVGMDSLIVPTKKLPFFDIPLSTRVDSALVLQRGRVAVELTEVQEKMVRAKDLPYVALIAQDQLDGPVTIDITPYDINYNYWFVGLALQYDISSLWKRGHRVRAARYATEQSKLEQQVSSEAYDVAVGEAFTRLEESRSALQIRMNGVKLAEENYGIVAERYANELALLVDILDAANSKVRAEIDLINAQIAHTFCLLKIQYLNGLL